MVGLSENEARRTRDRTRRDAEADQLGRKLVAKLRKSSRPGAPRRWGQESERAFGRSRVIMRAVQRRLTPHRTAAALA